MRGTVDFDPSGLVSGGPDFVPGPADVPRRPDYIPASRTPEQEEAARRRLAENAAAAVADLAPDEREQIEDTMARKAGKSQDPEAAARPPWVPPTEPEAPGEDIEAPEDDSESYTEEDGSYRCVCGHLAASLAGLRAHQRSKRHAAAVAQG